MRPSPAPDPAPDDRTRLERMALGVAFEANAAAELSEGRSLRIARVVAAARLLEDELEALAPQLGPDDRVVELARCVLGLLPDELKAAREREEEPPR